MQALPVSQPNATPIYITTFRGAKTSEPASTHTLAWSDFCAELDALLTHEQATKTGLTAIGPYKLRAGTKRGGANVESMSAVIALDFDALPDLDALVEQIKRLGLAAFVHTSPSDTGPGTSPRKARVYLLSEPHTPAQCSIARRAAAELLGEAFDASTLDPSRLFFAGNLTGSPARESWTIEGEPLPLEVLFALELVEPGPAPKASAPAPTVPNVATLTDALRVKLDRAIDLIEPHYVDGQKHEMAKAIGGYLRKAGLPALAAKYVVSRQHSADPQTRLTAVEWAYAANDPPGASVLRERAPELLSELDALFNPPLRGAPSAANDTDPVVAPRADAAFTYTPSKKRKRKVTGWLARTLGRMSK